MSREVNYGLVKDRIKRMYNNQESFAQALGCSLQTVNNKLQGRNALTIDDVFLWSELLNIGKYEIPDYFFYDYN